MGERALLRDALETGWDSTADLRPRPCSRPLRPAHAGATSFSPSANLIVSRAPTEKKPVSPSGGTDGLPLPPTSRESRTPNARLFGMEAFGSSCLSGILLLPGPESTHAAAEPLTQSGPTLA